MSTLQIRQVPEDVYQALAFRADREQRSLAQQAIVELRKMPELLARQRRLETLDHILADINSRQGASGYSVAPEELVREDRDR